MNEDIKTKEANTTLPPELDVCIQACQAKLAEEIVVLDLREITSFTDYFVILHGNSHRQNLAINESVSLKLKEIDIRPLSVEGRKNAEWILMDYGSFIVHIFTPDSREYYSLEKLWGDGIKHTF
jgi:ribosome-associated protein